MDFFAQQAAARKRTGFLVITYLVATLSIVAAVCAVVAGVLAAGGGGQLSLSRDGSVLALVALGTVTLIGGGSLFRVASLASGGRPVAEMLGGRLIDPNTRDPLERRALNVVEEMALAAGCPVPPVYLLDHEDGINAFAAGHDVNNAVIGLTRGAVERLTRDELQGVLGHEFSHILNGDMKLDLRMMGVLFGILLISIVGWTIFRATAGTRIRVRDSDGREREGANPLPIIGLGVYVVGYLGVLFARFIKAAVSRQREYLADASAVQFTRNPSGLAGALKKIGALNEGSRVLASRAEEASHLFFGEALGLSGWNPLASHPPLAERIRRLDPSFDGDFSRVPLTGPAITDQAPEGGSKLPGWIGAKMGTGGTPRPGMPTPRIPFDPAHLITSIGRPSPAQIALAASFLENLPDPIAEATHSPDSARSLVYALLVDRDDAGVAQSQFQGIEHRWGPETTSQATSMARDLDRLGPEARLPLVEMALPALRRMSRAQFRSFVETLRFMMEADQHISLFEYALRRMLMRALGPQYGWYSPPEEKFAEPAGLMQPVGVVLSAIAHVGQTGETDIESAYEQGFAALAWGSAPPLLPLDQVSLNHVDRALNQIAGAVPSLKRQFLLGAATTVGHDGQITIEESQLVRAVADALDCPMPPLIPTDLSVPTSA